MQIIKKKPAGVANISIFLILKLGGAGGLYGIIGIQLCVPPENNAEAWGGGHTLRHLQLHLTAQPSPKKRKAPFPQWRKQRALKMEE